MLLKIINLEAAYGDVQVLWGIDLEVGEREIVAIMGSNGAGKTTLIKTVSGLLKPRRGKIFFNGKDITGLPTPQRVLMGICHIPEGRQLFAGMTVKENIFMGAYKRVDGNTRKDYDWVMELFPVLKDREKQQAGTLSGGEQQMTAIARGLMSSPKLLLIDELSLGLAPVIVDHLVVLIKKIHQEAGVSILFIEQDVRLSLEMSSRGYVMENGQITKTAAAAELSNDEMIKKAYLGL